MKNIERLVDISKQLDKNKVLVIYGPRQVGKTTLVKDYLETTELKYKYYTGEDINFVSLIESLSLDSFIKEFSVLDLLVIDEAQLINNIGRAIKLIVDNVDKIKVILTGSSSFDLANKTAEPLTGRKTIVTLFPLSFLELQKLYSPNELSVELKNILIYGSYPAVLTSKTFISKEEKLRELADSYLLKDILTFDLIKNSKIIRDLLRLLAFQVGSEVSLSELGSNLGIDKNTISRYLDLLEKSFVIFRLGALSRNLRKEVYKTNKYYFFDLGIRNALISNFNKLELRNDVGQLWENYMIVERMKRNAYLRKFPNYYFWRTYDQKEIDFIEEKNGVFNSYEFKWKSTTTKSPSDFLNSYEGSTWKIINNDNYSNFIGK